MTYYHNMYLPFSIWVIDFPSWKLDSILYWDYYQRNSSFDDGNISNVTLTFTAFSDKFVIIAYPTRYGLKNFKDQGNFDFGVNSPTTVAITNPCGFTEDYYVYRSGNSLSYPAGNLEVTIQWW